MYIDYAEKNKVVTRFYYAQQRLFNRFNFELQS